VTNKRIILCKPKNLGLSMVFVDYQWEDVEASFVEEGILGSDFTFSTKSESTYTVDYLLKNQTGKLHAIAKEQLDLYKNAVVNILTIKEPKTFNTTPINVLEDDLPSQIQMKELNETSTEEVTNFTVIILNNQYVTQEELKLTQPLSIEKRLSDCSPDELFAKLQNYRSL
jgi:hypothetical protein